MKTRFGTVDLMAICHELQEKLVGMRVNQIYDIDKKTYLIRFQRTEEKAVLLFESGTRIHLTNYEWPKQPAPSGFTMKLRKHIKNKRLESLRQLGVDRIVDMQFGTADASYHVILELYDRGNIIFTDHEFVILNLLRPRTDNEDQRIAVGEKYPMDKVRGELRSLDVANWDETVSKAKPNDNLKKLLNPRLDFGPSLIEHCLLGAGFPPNAAIDKGYKHPEDAQRILEAMKTASELCRSSFKGYIVQKVEKRLKPDGSGEEEDFFTYQEYHPHKYSQYDSSPLLEFPGFSAAVDEFYSKMENQKVDLKVVQQEKMAMKKLENVIKDRENRLAGLQDAQDLDRQKGEMIQINLDLVEKALLVLRSAIANQMSWEEIGQMVKDAQARGDPIASTIRQLKLEMNHFTMALRNPYETPAIAEEKEDDEEIPVKNEEDEESEKSEEEEEKAGGDEPAKEEDQDDLGKKTKKGKGKPKKKPKDKGGKDKKKKKGEAGEKVEKGRKDGVMLVDIDIALSAFANARRYYDQKRHAALKEQKTLESTDKAFKSAQKKTKQVLKEVQAIASVNKARKPMWFEKFYWFISSENYLVIGGRDQQQNELIVKRYLRQNDIYVHADLHGASSVVIKNPKEGPVPPKTLNEAGTMAICYSSAWDAKVITNAWWVYANQVSKTAPTGEYLTTGSFMIRGKKNLMMPSHLIMGFGFLFKLEESSVLRHKGERRVKTAEEEAESLAEAVAEDLNGDGTSGDVDIPMEEGDDEDEEEEEASGLKGPEVDETKAELEQIREEADDEHAKEDGEKSGSETEEENDKSEESAEEEEEGKAESTPANVEFEFPDTKVTVVGDKLETKGTKGDSPKKDEEEVVIYLGDDKPLVLKPSEQRKKQQQKAKQLQQQQNNPKDKKAGDDKSSQQQNAPAGGDFEKDSQKPYKRGQKAKMKRVKEKYKDQDEEERKLRMVLHHQSISGKELNPKTKRGKKAKALEKQREDERRKAERAAQLEAKQKQNESKAKAKKADGGEELDIEDDDDDDKKELDDLSVLDTFTGAPVAEDELLFALPVVAPYAVFTNYKYKLKMTPGGAKRGKATKTALNIFAHDKAATQREKDLLKCVKEHDLTRNFPGKVKLSATTQQRKR